MISLNKILFLILACFLIISCQSNEVNIAQTNKKFEEAIKKDNTSLASELLVKLKKLNANNIISSEAKLLIAMKKSSKAKIILKNCFSTECNALKNEILKSEFNLLIEDGVTVSEYEKYINYLIIDTDYSQKEGLDLCNVIQLIESEAVLSRINNRLKFSTIIRKIITSEAQRIYSNVDLNRNIKAEQMNLFVNAKQPTLTGHLDNSGNYVVFKLAQEKGYELGHQLDDSGGKPRNLAEAYVVGYNAFRKQNENACEFMNRNLNDPMNKINQFSLDENGRKILVSIPANQLNTEIVHYHALIARYNDVFEYYEQIDETIHYSANKIIN